MNIILLSEEDFINSDEAVVCDSRRLSHILGVHRPSLGQEMRVGLINGPMGVGQVQSLGSDRVSLKVQLMEEAPEPLPIQLLLALPRPKNLRRILQTVTTLGIKDIVLFHSFQVDKNFWRSDLVGEEHLHESLILGLEQARDTLLPTIRKRRWFKPFVEDDVPVWSADRGKILADPRAQAPCPMAQSSPLSIVIGPEGGFLEYEVEKFHEQGYQSVTLSSRILKVETALTALVARLAAWS